MLPQKRPALFRVTGMAGFVDGIFHEQFRPGRAMRVVAIAAGDSARGNRMGGKVMHFSALTFVAGKTDIALRFFRKHFVLRLMDFVARRAGHVVTLMRATGPMEPPSRRMTIQAGAALHVGGRFVRAIENKIRHGTHYGVIHMPEMRAARAMAGLTPRLPGHTVPRAVN